MLASQSPRRRALLEEAGFSLHVVRPEVVELPRAGESPVDYATRNAEEKAAWVYASNPALLEGSRVVLAADTIVVLDGRVLEKPADAADAGNMLRHLSNRLHTVTTGICLRKGNTVRSFSVETKVYFRRLTEPEIKAYVETGEPKDKAGAYAIQGGAASFVERIEGSYANVVGLPVERVVEELKTLFPE